MARNNKKSKEYLSLVHTLPCVISGMSCVSAHHIKEGNSCGMGMKSPDWYAIPLSYKYHQGDRGIHQIGTKTWRKVYGSELDFAKQTQDKLKHLIEIPEQYKL